MYHRGVILHHTPPLLVPLAAILAALSPQKQGVYGGVLPPYTPPTDPIHAPLDSRAGYARPSSHSAARTAPSPCQPRECSQYPPRTRLRRARNAPFGRPQCALRAPALRRLSPPLRGVLARVRYPCWPPCTRVIQRSQN